MLYELDMSFASPQDITKFYEKESKRYESFVTTKLKEIQSDLKAEPTSQLPPLTDIDLLLYLKVISNFNGNMAYHGIYHGEIMIRLCNGERFSEALRTQINEIPEDEVALDRRYLDEYDKVVAKFFFPASTTSAATTQEETQNLQRTENLQRCSIL